MSEGTVRQCSKMYKDGRKNVHAEELVSDDLVQNAKSKKVKTKDILERDCKGL
jgi:hypothetical protein